MIYRLPTLADENILTDYIREHHENGEESISASMGLPVMQYTQWHEKILRMADSGEPEWGRALLLLCMKNDRLIGLLSIRYGLPQALSEKYGDIGYGVRPSERGKGYATEMMKYTLKVCRDHGRDSVIVGCYKDNAASDAVIRKCGGRLIAVNDNYKSGRLSCYYRIET